MPAMPDAAMPPEEPYASVPAALAASSAPPPAASAALTFGGGNYDATAGQLVYSDLEWDDTEAVRLVLSLQQYYPGLKTLDLSKNILGTQTAAALAQYLRHNTSLTALLLHDNEFEDAAAKDIAKAVAANKRSALAVLDLHGQRPWHLRPKDAPEPGPPISQEGAGALATAFLARNLPTSLNLEGTWLPLHQLRGVSDAIETLDLSCRKLGVASLVVLAKCLEDNRQLKRLVLKQNRIDAEGAKVVGDALVGSAPTEAPTRPRAVPNRSATHAWRTPRLGADRTLRELSLEYNELGVRGAQEVGNALSLNRSLTRLNLSRNGLGPKGAEAMAARLCGHKTLTEVDLTVNGFGEAGWCALFDRLHMAAGDAAAYDAVARETTDRRAAATARRERDARLSVLASWPLRNQGLTPAAGRALASYVSLSPSVTALDLGLNKLGPEGGRALAAALRHGGALKRLDASRNGLGPEGARALADALQVNGSLTSLDLEGNQIGPEGARALAGALLVNGSVHRLNLAANELCGVDVFGKGAYTAEGVAALAGAVRTNDTLRELVLKQNALGAAGARVVGDALAANRTLTSCSLSLNQLCGRDAWGRGAYDSAGISALATAIRIAGSDMGRLTSLDLAANELDAQAEDSLRHAERSVRTGNFTLML